MSPRQCVSVLAFLLVAFTCIVNAGPLDAQWKEVEEAVQKGLPKTAIEKLGPIIEGALADKAYAEAVKAIGKKIAWEGTFRRTSPRRKVAVQCAQRESGRCFGIGRRAAVERVC